MDHIDVELLIAEQALRNDRDYVARCARRLKEAESEFQQAIRDMNKHNGILTRLRAKRRGA